MTGRELLEKLQALTPEELDLEVYSYLFVTEDGAFPATIAVIHSYQEPYHKGDGPWSGGDVHPDKKLLFIE